MSGVPSTGPLAGIRVVEVDGIGASPFASMLLADLGAEVVRLQRPGSVDDGGIGVAPGPVMCRGRRLVLPIDLKSDAGRELLFELVDVADVVTEAFRPGVAERLGIGPDEVRRRNPRVVYGRMTGWGREGPLAQSAGHDINYIALAGVLGAMGRPESPPPPPLALAGDMGGGGMLLALGLLAALLEREQSGHGQVVDAAMVDGAALLMAAFWEQYHSGQWLPERGSNLVDGGAPFYDTYICKDGRYVAVGALEPQFWETLVGVLDLDLPPDIDRLDRSRWPEIRAIMQRTFLERTRDEWCARLEGTDACFSPVLDFQDAADHPHNVHRHTFVTISGIVQPAAAPRFSRTAARTGVAPTPETDPVAALDAWGIDPQHVVAVVGGDAR